MTGRARQDDGAEGAPFACRRCGACCREPGFVRLESGEAEALAEALGMDARAFADAFTDLSADRRALVLKDAPGGACALLSPSGLCRANAAKPRQCRGFPHSWRNADSATVCPALRAAP